MRELRLRSTKPQPLFSLCFGAALGGKVEVGATLEGLGEPISALLLQASTCCHSLSLPTMPQARLRPWCSKKVLSQVP